MRSFRRFRLGACLICFCLLASTRARAQSTPALSIERVGQGFSEPLFVTAAPGDATRLFVVEQHTGKIRILNLAAKTNEATPFLTVTNITKGGEQGLLGLAFHPGYATNGFFFVNYTTPGGGPAGHTEITRFQVQGNPATSNVADPTSKIVFLTYDQPEENHNGGWLGFGRDGYLYIAAGDGGGANDQHGPIGNGQNRNVLLGKILRIDVDHGTPYAIPTGNPFQGMTGMKEEIWAFGLRNPWRCSIDRQTGDLWIGDVGQGAREEIDFDPAGVGGLNFGWRPREGTIQNPAYPNERPVVTATEPVHDYGHALGIAVIGGYVYRGPSIPALNGTYFFGDYGSGRLWSFRYDGTNKTEFVERTAQLNGSNPKPIGNLSSFGEDGIGELYFCDLSDGEIYKLVASQPVASLQLVNPTADGNQFQFQFTTLPGTSYVVEARPTLETGAWQTLTNIVTTASTPRVTVTDSLSSTQRFYRVRTLSQ